MHPQCTTLLAHIQLSKGLYLHFQIKMQGKVTDSMRDTIAIDDVKLKPASTQCEGTLLAYLAIKTSQRVSKKSFLCINSFFCRIIYEHTNV